MAAELRDRIGIGWREPIAAGIFTRLAEIDAVELIAENCMSAGRRARRSLRDLGRDVPTYLHGVGLGLASVSPVDPRRLDRLARVIGELQPRAWSEHLAFVRSGGYEIGHLAAPPRNEATIAGAERNLRRIRSVVGSTPAVENIATLMMPPASPCAEPEWVSAIAGATASPLLLDLHNLYANAVNFGHEPMAYLRRFALERVEFVHISGGVWVTGPGEAAGERRLLDDHLHDVPQIVFDMLTVLGERCEHALTVILERDGNFPAMSVLTAQIVCARRALAEGRRRVRAGRAEPATVGKRHELAAP